MKTLTYITQKLWIVMFFVSYLNMAQTTESRDEYMNPEQLEDIIGILPPCNCPEASHEDFSFNWNIRYSIALSNAALLEEARRRDLRNWFYRQKSLIKTKLETKFNTSFANYNEAINELFYAEEIHNINRYYEVPKAKYHSLKSNVTRRHNNYLRDLKLLNLRKSEILAGKVNTSEYGYLKVEDTMLKNMNLSTIISKWNRIYTAFGMNYGIKHYYTNVYNTIRTIASNNDFKAHAIQMKNRFYNGFNAWDQLNYVQFLMNFEEVKRLTSPPYFIPPLLDTFNKFKDTDRVNSTVIENWALQNSGMQSSFFTRPCTIRIPAGRGHISIGIPGCKEGKRNALNRLLNGVNAERLKIENLIAELEITNIAQKTWLLANRTEAQKIITFLKDSDTYTAAKNFAITAVEALVNNGSVDFEDKIINELTGKAKCVYDKLEQLSGGFKNMIQKFDGEFPVAHLKYSIDNNLPNSISAVTNNSGQFLIEIKLNGNTLGQRTVLGLARTLAHETIHAELYRKVRSVNNQISINDFPGIYDYYRRHIRNWQHEQMAAHYRETIANIIQDYDNNQNTRQFYMDLAWEGLHGTTTWNNLSNSEQSRVVNVINNHKANGNKNCN